MNIITLAVASIRYRLLSNVLNGLILAFGIAVIVTLLHLSAQVEQRFDRDLRGIDLVAGAKGSPLQLIFSSVFHLDVPVGNISLSEARKLEKNPLVKSAIPIALGDNYQGFRIVGTRASYIHHYDAALAQGELWKTPMQAVLGADVAHVTHLQVGDRFAGSHGLDDEGEKHAEFPYEVTGILAPSGSVLDRLILTDISSVWNVHEHHHHEEGDTHDDDEEATSHHGAREITSLLVSYKSPLAAATLPRMINKTSSMQAASPAFEMARMLRILGIGTDTIRLFGLVLIVIASAGFFVTLLNAVTDRRYDIALMRSLGVTRMRIFAMVLLQGLILGTLGIIAGLALGHGLLYALARWMMQTHHMVLNPLAIHPYEGHLAAITLGASIIAALIPAFMAYRVNVSQLLARGT